MTQQSLAGPLAGVRVVELAGIGPAPMAAMMLADLGADVVRIERRDAPQPGTGEVVGRGRQALTVDLKQDAGRDVVRDLVGQADVFLEGFRPGVVELLGLGPDDLLAVNPRLVYCRLTGWGQDGPLARTAGHDLTYLARSGQLARFRRSGERPVAPANLLGDFGGGTMFAVTGILAALVDRASSGRGQVVDTAIVDGVGYLATFLVGLERLGGWPASPGGNLLDTGAPFYEVYACADDDPSADTGRWVAVAAVEDRFYAELLQRAAVRGQVDDVEWDLLRPERRRDPATWPAAKRVWERIFAGRTRDEWVAVFAAGDACVEPVLSPAEAQAADSRDEWTPGPGGPVPTPAPRLSLTPARVAAPTRPADVAALLRDLGRSERDIVALYSGGVVA